MNQLRTICILGLLLSSNMCSSKQNMDQQTSYGVFAPEIIHVLNEIKSVETAKIIADSLLIVNPTGLLDNDYKAFIFKVLLSEQQKAHLYAMDIRYDQLQDQENLEDLLGDYLQVLVKS